MFNSNASVGGRAPSLPHNRLALPANVSARCFYTGGTAPQVSTDFTNSTPVITELYLAEILVPMSCTVTGIALFNGSDVTNNVKAGLFDVSGTLLAVSTSAAGFGADAFQKLPFTSEFLSSTTGVKATLTSPVVLTGGTYFIGVMFDGTTSRFNTHTIGAFAAGKVTGLVYATAMDTLALTINPPATFTTALGPVAGLY